MQVNVEIWIRYENSPANCDELEDVLDYNVMRDALLFAARPVSSSFVQRALDELLTHSVEAAYVEVVHDTRGLIWCGFRQVGDRASARVR
ncbi:hypothetical protein [Paraburkholderia phenoliruptrix]|uniref:hypothetical protein n=1 Tax=Paraburkholderia phenoliruptrix TaxID=252970 RepID=UPI002869A50A|nr:hypothetical protein [Paraburkholderia phenoliruptrix]WMY11018.1 hypothetical protein P3F88_30555 [Paraburkholderia phenoliruptrix]